MISVETVNELPAAIAPVLKKLDFIDSTGVAVKTEMGPADIDAVVERPVM